MAASFPSRGLGRACALAGLSLVCALSAPAYAVRVTETNLVTDDQAFLTSLGYTPAASVDPRLINPWGVSYGPTGPFWVSNQGSGTSTLYNGAGTPQALVVTIPGASTGPSGPTGQVFNSGTGFNLANGNKSLFLFANLDGSVSGWNAGAGTTAQVVVPRQSGAVYTGLTTATSGGNRYLYAANNAAGRIDVFNASFQPTTLTGNFVDPGPNPNGAAPFNVKALGGNIFVTFAVGGANADDAALGSGFVSEFAPDGTFIRRIASGATVGSPWGLAIAPASFGTFAGSLLVGNFSAEFGYINAFNLTTGAFLGQLTFADGTPVNQPYLWEILPGNGGAAGSPNSLYFAAGIGDEAHGLFGRYDPAAVPEPASWAMMILGFGGTGLVVRHRRARVQAA